MVGFGFSGDTDDLVARIRNEMVLPLHRKCCGIEALQCGQIRAYLHLAHVNGTNEETPGFGEMNTCFPKGIAHAFEVPRSLAPGELREKHVLEAHIRHHGSGEGA